MAASDDVNCPSVVHLDVVVHHIGRQDEPLGLDVVCRRRRPRDQPPLCRPSGGKYRPCSERSQTGCAADSAGGSADRVEARVMGSQKWDRFIALQVGRFASSDSGPILFPEK